MEGADERTVHIEDERPGRAALACLHSGADRRVVSVHREPELRQGCVHADERFHGPVLDRFLSNVLVATLDDEACRLEAIKQSFDVAVVGGVDHVGYGGGHTSMAHVHYLVRVGRSQRIGTHATPPFTKTVWPLTHRAGPARKATASAMSLGVPSL